MSDLLIGVDAGGSKTRVLITTTTGQTVADVTGPGATMAPGDAEHCASVIASVVRTALTEMKQPKRKGAKSSESRSKKRGDKNATPTETPTSSDESADEESPYADPHGADDINLTEIVAEDEGEDENDDDAEDDVSPERAVDEDVIAEASEESNVSLHLEHARPLILFAGVAGTGREEEQIALQEALQRLDLADEVVVETDATIALADAFGEDSGIVLVAGTGSIAFGKSPAGLHARCGGWGITIGDEGSGAWMGRKALSVVTAAHDGREPETALTGALLTAAQVNEVEELIPWSIAADKESLGALAPTVLAIAMQGDLRANAIVDMAVEELMLHIRALGKRLFIDERAAFDVALTGGLLKKGSLIRKRLEKRIKTAVPGATVKPDPVDGARGAIKLARLMLNHAVV